MTLKVQVLLLVHNVLAMNIFLTIKKMKQYLELLKNAFALNSIMAIFDDDAHRIVSKRGESILRDKGN